MSDCQVIFCNFGCISICFAGLLCCLALLVATAELCNVAVVVCLHLLIEHFGFRLSGLWNEALIQELEDGVTNLLQLILNLDSVVLGIASLSLVAFGLLLLLHA
eukprot:Skav212808  [mRNA]  locus=scaffold1633:257078:257578:+ [translate_table: standard]